MTKLFFSFICLAALAQEPSPWPATAMLAPATLANEIRQDAAPPVIFVGFPILYQGAHIPKAIFAGPCSKPEGLALLNKASKSLRHDSEIVIYCGCCPFVHCPNVRPAYAALKEAGFTNIRILQLETNLHTDWVVKGYPTEKVQ